LFAANPLCIEARDGNVALVNLARANEADARLIAAAPELLAALRLILPLAQHAEYPEGDAVEVRAAAELLGRLEGI
jgi:hypothetical protein